MLLVPKWRHSIAKDVSEMPPKGWAVYALSNLFDAGGYALLLAHYLLVETLRWSRFWSVFTGICAGLKSLASNS